MSASLPGRRGSSILDIDRRIRLIVVRSADRPVLTSSSSRATITSAAAGPPSRSSQSIARSRSPRLPARRSLASFSATSGSRPMGEAMTLATISSDSATSRTSRLALSAWLRRERTDSNSRASTSLSSVNLATFPPHASIVKARSPSRASSPGLSDQASRTANASTAFSAPAGMAQSGCVAG